MKKILLLLLLVSPVVFSQGNLVESVNDFKNVIVPSKFPFLKEADQFMLNTYTKMYLEKYGFVAFFDTDKLPTEVADQNCNKLYVELLEEKSMFQTKLTVLLKDCRNNVLYTSTSGKSREKDFKVAYQQALREAFSSFDNLNYKYNGKNNSAKKELKPIEKVVLKDDFERSNDKVITAEDVAKSQQNNSVNKLEVDSGMIFPKNAKLLAVKKPNGYELIFTNDSDVGQSIMTIFRTSMKNTFIANQQQGLRNGVLVNKNGQWFFEFYENDKFFSEPLQIPSLKVE